MEDLPCLEGYCKISNFGKVKLLEYEIEYRNDAINTKKEKVIKPEIGRQKNTFTNNTNYFLVNRVSVDGLCNNLVIARLVYYCFVRKFNLRDRNINILCKDGNTLIIRPSNLMQATLGEKKQKDLLAKAHDKPTKKLSAINKKKQRQAIAVTFKNLPECCHCRKK